ncbi:hypothetical protein DNY73_16815 [Salmonella enterica subsp. diarizonae]|nr:hypothetical protein [Salmonella enterica subsp. diarizonae]EAS6510049.1 hypothetical protein [Salmonella enterica]EAT1906229.1 hypothetical protein [Salmonella enterica]
MYGFVLLVFIIRGCYPTPHFFGGEIMGSIALILFGFIVIYSLVIVVAAFADDFFRKNRSR